MFLFVLFELNLFYFIIKIFINLKLVASHILLVDSPAGTKEEAIAYDSQAIARSHRIGQEKQVTVIRFIVEHSIDHDDYIKAYG